jgi:hypothetical protein
LTGVPAGEYQVGFFHPRLTALGVFADPQDVAVVAGESQELRLTLPGQALRLAVASVCPALPRDTGGVMGFVREGERRARVGGADVEFRWSRFELSEVSLIERWHRLAVTANDAGFYTACDLPSDRTVRGQARQGARISPEVQLELREAAMREHDFTIAAPPSR